jgi:RHS repeat-associated protein
MITDTITSTGDVWTYSYNFRGQMTGAVEKTSGGTVLAQVTYTYDALGNRIGMDENGTQTWTLYDGSDPIMDFNSSGSLEMRYLNGPAGQLVDSVLARESSGGTVAWYLPDRLGTVRDVINNSGAIIDHTDFSAFGTVLDQSDPSEGDRMMGFGGMELDSVTGMNLAVYRVQNPGTGRWTSEDPLGFAAGDTNLERYVGNTPANDSDSGGLQADPGPNNNIPWLRSGGRYQYSLSPAQEQFVADMIGLTLQALAALQKCGAISGAEFKAREKDLASLRISKYFTDWYNPRTGVITYGYTYYSLLGGGPASTTLYSDFFNSQTMLPTLLETLIHEGYHSGQRDLGPEGPDSPAEQAGKRLAHLIVTSPCTSAIVAKMRSAKQKLYKTQGNQPVPR